MSQSGSPSSVPWRFRGAANAAFSGVTAIEFDRTCELLWLGDAFGHVTSFALSTPSATTSSQDEIAWSTYSSFRPFVDTPCQHIQFLHDSLIAMATNNKIRVTKRGGVTVLNYDAPTALQRRIGFFQTDYDGGAMYLAGETPGVQRITLARPDESEQTASAEGITSALRFGDDWVAVGTTGGSLSLRHPLTLEPIASIKPFASRITAVAGSGQHIWAASSERNLSNVVKVFDTRQMSEPLNVISGLQGGAAASLRVYTDHAAIERAFLVTSQGFHMLQVDAPMPTYSSVGMEGGSITAGAVTSSGIGAVLGNDKGYLLTMSNAASTEAFSIHSQPRQPPQPKAHHDNHHHAWSQNATNRGQLDSGFDYEYPEGELCSNWPSNDYMLLSAESKLKFMNIRVPQGQVMVNTWNLTRADLYAPDPKDKVNIIIPNPYPYNSDLGDDPSKVQTLLQDLRKSKRNVTRAKGETTGLYSKQEEALQACYGGSNQTAFQWGAYNPTREVIGIDNSTPESWVSPVLQSLYLCHAPHYPVRKAFVNHVCKKEYCIACEVAIIFTNMMITSSSNSTAAALGSSAASLLAPVVQPAGLLRCMTQLPLFVEAGLFVPTVDRDHAVRKIHLTQKLLLEVIDRDLRIAPEFKFIPHARPSSTNTSVAGAAVGFTAASPIMSTHLPFLAASSDGTLSPGMALSSPLTGFPMPGLPSLSTTPPLAPLLGNNPFAIPSLQQQPQAPVDLDGLMVTYFGTEFQVSSHRNAAHGGAPPADIPPRFFWEVPASAVKVDEGLQHLLKQLESYNGDPVQIKRLPPIIILLLNPEHGNLKPPSSLKFSRPPKEEFNYLLSSNVLHLAEDVDDSGLFVGHHQTGDRENFVLVNDYLVSTPQPEELLEASIPATTTHSVVLTCYALDSFRSNPKYQSKDVDATRPPNLFDTLGPLLIHDDFAAPLQKLWRPSPDGDDVAPPPFPQRFQSAITSHLDIQPGDIVAIDAEYVVLAWGNKRPDEPEWIRRQRKPHMSLARVSCILSGKDGDERTIMDDYVHTPEDVLDYVTLYSGIHEGDLDPTRSTKNLTALKATQYKLRALVDRGVRFVGHGLPQDFRVCNVVVPPSQIIDTLELFHRSGHRKLSLRFLAYLVLGERVQEDEHDSVEDARTSLRLYRKYQEAQLLGVFETLMDHIIARGHETNWYVPSSAISSPPPPASSSSAVADSSPSGLGLLSSPLEETVLTSTNDIGLEGEGGDDSDSSTTDDSSHNAARVLTLNLGVDLDGTGGANGVSSSSAAVQALLGSPGKLASGSSSTLKPTTQGDFSSHDEEDARRDANNSTTSSTNSDDQQMESDSPFIPTREPTGNREQGGDF
ncbi:cysteine clan family c19 ubiquitin hydrolase, putative [Bodo saltans]|uniref:Cysteine clan family c19 ubiquitin hydrolase, putative n=1 Tax=Bodo saltans TaxID=75058 RepID=A0A0S4JSF3_BODSA|nr:cysteine clan family c19 ubiquitin hydrolase, putative [Bodo saltans]|eukprot:CUG94412.1 cysteine clan family c19 ubiquitin hydrolase, putative [Bodo saltans]